MSKGRNFSDVLYAIRTFAVLGAVAAVTLSVAGVIRGDKAAEPRRNPAAGIRALGEIKRRLTERFNDVLSDPQDYHRKVRRECRDFPEGDLFPYTLPAIAYANLALADAKDRPNALKRMQILLDRAIVAVAGKVRPPGGKLVNLKDYGRHATYLGQLNLALGYYRLISGGGRYDAIHRRISDVLHDALVRAGGRPLESFPSYSWTFDTIPCLVSLKLYDRCTAAPRSNQAIQRHLKWIQANAIHKPTGLPYSRIDRRTGKGSALPRGCELSWRIALMSHLDPERAGAMYRAYVKSFWLDRTLIRGFAEWPGGRSARQDLDSGVVLQGVGMTASGMGLSAARSQNDTVRLAALTGQITNFRTLLSLVVKQSPSAKARMTLGGRVNPDSRYITGFLYGDVCLLYSATWQPWPTRPRPTTQAGKRGLTSIGALSKAKGVVVPVPFSRRTRIRAENRDRHLRSPLRPPGYAGRVAPEPVPIFVRADGPAHITVQSLGKMSLLETVVLRPSVTVRNQIVALAGGGSAVMRFLAISAGFSIHLRALGLAETSAVV